MCMCVKKHNINVLKKKISQIKLRQISARPQTKQNTHTHTCRAKAETAKAKEKLQAKSITEKSEAPTKAAEQCRRPSFFLANT